MNKPGDHNIARISNWLMSIVQYPADENSGVKDSGTATLVVRPGSDD
jgi:hypothetical protein